MDFLCVRIEETHVCFFNVLSVVELSYRSSSTLRHTYSGMFFVQGHVFLVDIQLYQHYL